MSKINYAQKTPISYYGGKQKLAWRICHELNATPHQIYCEPFIGGGAVFYAKQPMAHEIINDINFMVVNFWRVATFNRELLINYIRQNNLYSQELHGFARKIYHGEIMVDDVQKAWAFFYLSKSCFGAQIGAGFGIGKYKPQCLRLNNIAANIDMMLMRLNGNLTIMNTDALRIIKQFDATDTLFYCDPPYVDTNQGHYDGYKQHDFDNLIKALANIKGKFALSHYSNEYIKNIANKHNWRLIEYQTSCTANIKIKNKSRTEALIMGGF